MIDKIELARMNKKYKRLKYKFHANYVATNFSLAVGPNTFSLSIQTKQTNQEVIGYFCAIETWNFYSATHLDHLQR